MCPTQTNDLGVAHHTIELTYVRNIAILTRNHQKQTMPSEFQECRQRNSDSPSVRHTKHLPHTPSQQSQNPNVMEETSSTTIFDLPNMHN